MKGELQILYPDRGPEMRQYYGNELPNTVLQQLLGGTLAIVPLFDHFPTYDGRLVPSVVFCNEDASALQLLDNHWATALWHYIVRSKGEKRQLIVLKGPVVVVSGDHEFMEAL